MRTRRQEPAGKPPKLPDSVPALTRTDLWLTLGSGAAALCAYLATLCPTVGPADSGELTLAAMKLGICHPPGYPLFTWLGRLATLLPLGEPALLTNGLTALIAAAVVAFLYLAARSSNLSRVASTATALVFGFSATFWESATGHEVYALSMLLLVLLLFVLPRARLSPSRMLPLAGLLLGLAGAHQPSALFWVPALAVLAWKPDRNARPAILLFVVMLAVGFSSSLGTLFLSLSRPEMNWGDPSNLSRFLVHITARDYSPMGLVGSVFGGRAGTWPRIVSGEFGLPAVLFALAGVVFLFRRSRRVLVALLLLFAVGIFGLGYSVADFRVQMLPHFLAIALLAGAGIHWLDTRLRRVSRALGPVVLAIPLFTLVFNARDATDARTTLIRDLGSNIAKSLPPDAAYFHAHDIEANALKYAMAVTEPREDVLVVSTELLADRDYWKELGGKIPLPALDGLKRRAASDAQRLGRAATWQTTKYYLVDAVLAALLPSRSVFLSVGMLDPALLESPAMKNRSFCPGGLVNMVLPDTAGPPPPAADTADYLLWGTYELGSARRKYRTVFYSLVQEYYPVSRLNAGLYLLTRGRTEAGVRKLRAALDFPLSDRLRAAVEGNLSRAAQQSRQPVP